MTFYITTLDEDDERIDQKVMGSNTPWAEVQEAARQASLHPDAAVVIVAGDGLKELWRYPEGYDA